MILDLPAVVKQIVKDGPKRVVINRAGEATTKEEGFRILGIKPTIIYIRNDGWSIGCTPDLDVITNHMWQDEWAAVAWYHEDENKWFWRPWGDSNGAQEV